MFWWKEEFVRRNSVLSLSFANCLVYTLISSAKSLSDWTLEICYHFLHFMHFGLPLTNLRKLSSTLDKKQTDLLLCFLFDHRSLTFWLIELNEHHSVASDSLLTVYLFWIQSFKKKFIFCSQFWPSIVEIVCIQVHCLQFCVCVCVCKFTFKVFFFFFFFDHLQLDFRKPV